MFSVLLAVGVCASVWLSASSRAFAAPPPRIVMEKFRGPQAGGLKSSLEQSLEESQVVTLIAEKKVKAAKKKLKIRRSLKKAQYAKLSKKLAATSYISGSVRKKRRGWSLSVRVKDARGKTMGSKLWSGRTLAALRSIRRNGFKKLKPLLKKAGRSKAPEKKPVKVEEEPDEEVDDEVEEEPVKKARRGKQRRPKKRPKDPAPFLQDDDDEEDDEDDTAVQEGSEDAAASKEDGKAAKWYGGAKKDGEEEAPRSHRGLDRLEALSINLTAGVLNRNFGTNVGVYERFRNVNRQPTDTNIINEERKYASGGFGHFELGLQGEVYPGQFLKKPFLQWFGLYFEFRNSVGLATDSPKNGAPNETIAMQTTQREIAVGLRTRYRFGDKQRSPRIWADIGWGQFSFLFDVEDLKQVDRSTIIPPMQYDFINLGAGGSYGLLPKYLTVGFHAGYRLAFAQGVDARRIWGTGTGPSNGLSLGVDLRSEAPYFFEGAYWGLEFEYFYFTTKFKGQTQCLADGPGCAGETNTPELWEPWPYDGSINEGNISAGGGVLGAVRDAYIRVGFKFGYSFR